MAFYEQLMNETGRVEIDGYPDEGVVYLEAVDLTFDSEAQRGRGLVVLTPDEARRVGEWLLKAAGEGA